MTTRLSFIAPIPSIHGKALHGRIIQMGTAWATVFLCIASYSYPPQKNFTGLPERFIPAVIASEPLVRAGEAIQREETLSALLRR
ncbi:MAG: hypothetical protein LBT00_00385 [Spirochaetaceae bacterium]|jgi:hypothetical protein|nr:hypothetical protein [Spirochaetaceae bacterium]